MLNFLREIFSRKPKKVLPVTFEEAVQYVRENFVIDDCYYSGMNIRNELGLWYPESKLRDHMKETYGIDHPDDIYYLIKKALMDLSFSMEKELKYLNAYYKKDSVV